MSAVRATAPIAGRPGDDVHWLLLDSGNSALKWVLVTPDGRIGPAHGSVRNAPPAEMLPGLVREWGARAPGPVEAAFGCGVSAPVLMRAIGQAVTRIYGVGVEWFESQAHFAYRGVQLHNGYRDAAQLGVDRWHALLAARASYRGRSLVVVTAGTATTVDGVTLEGTFIGGAIAPGVRMMFDALARGTANLPFSSGNAVSFPDNTDDAIASGVIGSQIGLIERFVRSFRAEHGEPQIILSGGYAHKLAPYVGIGTSLPAVIREENLVLRGVLLRAQASLGLAHPAQTASGP